ncbi:AAA family ATPase [Bradyrhizobium hereditatis]|uniref:AAA family ATPase n=1 Tax=Bradyrhizobium hereditatis TaxID=2821405 RepID=UPI001CE238B9|nr:AAA family ATPase [Bradyrhizobium hereditatis]
MNNQHVERRLAAILAADVAGSCRLIGIDEEGTLEQLKALRKNLFDPKVTDNRGRIVKNTGDGALVEFASVVDAVRCADEIQRGMAERNITVPQNERIEFRIGIHVGDIIVEENDIFGDAVNIAVRLEGIAEPGGIYISDDARRQIRAKIGLDYDDLGSRLLRNISEPIHVWRIRANGLTTARDTRLASRDPLAAGPAAGMAKPDRPELISGEQNATAPTVLTDPRSHQMVGRDASFQLLDRITQRMLTGQRQIALVTGEAGIGKTAFIEMAVDRLTQRGVDFLCGRCTERFGTDEVFLPLIDALVTRCRTTGGGELLTAIRTHAPTWLLHIPGSIDAAERAALQNEVFGATRERMLREFCDLLEALSTTRPWVLVLEDLHWSDFATLDVLSRFARGRHKISALVLVSYRPADSAIGGHPIRRLHQDLEIHGCCTELRLDRLSRAEVEQYVTLRFGDNAFASTIAGAVFERTQGQPLFIASLLKHFIDQRAVVEIDGAWCLSAETAISQDDVPNDLLNMISYQVGRLTEDERRLLDVASVAGVEFSAALVAASLSRDAVEIERDLDALARKDHMLVPIGATEWPDGTYSGSYAFRHILYQNVIYQHLAPGQRVQTHRRLGNRLEKAYHDRTSEIASVLALHFEQGRDFESALRYLVQAAESSAKRLGHAEAASYLTRGLGILDRFDAADRFRARIAVLRQRSLALRSCGDLAGSVSDLNEMIACARQAGELRQEVAGLLALSRYCLHADRRVCLQATEDVLVRSQGLEDDAFKAMVQGSSASINLYLKGWQEQDAALCMRAMELSAGAQDHGTLLRRYGIQGILDCWRSRYQECRHSAAHGKRLASEAGDVYVFVIFNVLDSTALIHLGEWRELQLVTTAAMELAKKNANEPASALCRLTLAWMHVEAMDFGGARALCEGVDDRILNENQFAYFIHRAVLAKAFVGLGDLQRASKQFDDVQRRLDEDGVPLDFTIFTQLYHCLGEYCLQIAEFDRARRWAIQLRDYAAPAPDRNHLSLAHGLLARIAFAAGDREEARDHLSRALPIVNNADFPLAAWRVYSAATEIFMNIGETGEAIKYQNRFATVLRTLAQNFDANDYLHNCLLTALATKTTRWGLTV